ncbi:DNA mismatch repair endonuclease MutL [Treponema pectinovorum]|uniref:DNA mismatch repair endonuclease MutL n=1 Tax=Treponema pectinovorum TaxID=164 RepID=UPI003D8C8F62
MEKQIRRPVRVLSAEVSRKIAAGEVIDRPNAIVRELMDNAVDSGADSISVEICGGGIEKIRVSDNGFGMTKDDLSSCARPHATSKIVNASDLMNLTTLGFRGEALASIAAVSRLSILSGNHKMTASITEDHVIEEIPPVQNGKGTIVMSEGLFENYPARRVFLKREASENLLCKETFIEKSLPKTDISFRLTVDGQVRLDLPKDVSLAERFVQALQLNENPENFAELKSSDEKGWSFRLVIGQSHIYRNDRKQIYIYVNGRRVVEYSLVQAIEYGCQGFFPNGTHPVASLFVQINPSLVDFNIHPAKKEVRFRDSSAIHHAVSSTVKEYFRSYGIKNSEIFETQKNQPEKETNAFFDFEYEQSSQNKIPTYNSPSTFFREKTYSSPYSIKDSSSSNKNKNTAGENDFRSKFFNYESSIQKKSYTNEHNFSNASADLALQALAQDKNEDNPSNPQFTTLDENGFCYIGSVMNCFLVAQVNDTVYFIDQHAAHERILFDKITSSKAERQNLLIPYTIETQDEDEEKYLNTSLKMLEDAGFSGKNTGNGKFEFSSVHSRWQGSEEDFRAAILDRLVSPKDIIYSVAAMTACKAAVKDGYVLDRGAAEDLAKKALALKDPHCPHGRPIWTTLTKQQLFDRVRRTR